MFKQAPAGSVAEPRIVCANDWALLVLAFAVNSIQVFPSTRQATVGKKAFALPTVREAKATRVGARKMGVWF